MIRRPDQSNQPGQSSQPEHTPSQLPDAAYRRQVAGSMPERMGWTITIRPRTIWLALGAVVLFICLALIVLKAFYVIAVLSIAIIFAEGIRPLVNWLHARRVPRPLAVLLIYLGLAILLAFLAWLLLNPLLSQLSDFTTSLPATLTKFQTFVKNLQQRLGGNSLIGQLGGNVSTLVGGLLTSLAPTLLRIPLLIGTFLVGVVVVIVMAFFWLTGIDALWPFCLSLLPEPVRPEAEDILHETGSKLGEYLRGVALNMFVIGLLSGVADWILGASYPLLLGILAGLTEVIPYFGPWISGAVAAAATLIVVGPLHALWIVLAYIVIQQIEGHTLIPVVMMRAVKLNPLVVVIAALLGTEALGLLGGVLAVPAAAVAETLVVRVVAPVVRMTAARTAQEMSGARDAPEAQEAAQGESGDHGAQADHERAREREKGDE